MFDYELFWKSWLNPSWKNHIINNYSFLSINPSFPPKIILILVLQKPRIVEELRNQLSNILFSASNTLPGFCDSTEKAIRLIESVILKFEMEGCKGFESYEKADNMASNWVMSSVDEGLFIEAHFFVVFLHCEIVILMFDDRWGILCTNWTRKISKYIFHWLFRIKI